MCTQPLNPEAEEYRPLLLSAPPLPVALQQYYLYLPNRPYYPIHTHYTHYPHPIPTTLPVHLYPDAAAAAAPPESTEAAASPHSVPTVKSPKCPSTGAPRKHLPPRRRKARRPAHAPAPPSPPPAQTTLMIKNIPNQLRRDCMLEFLDCYCRKHSVAYDFIYLPIDFENPNHGNKGYAYVNFTTAAAAMKMKEEMNKYKWKGRICKGKILYSKKVIETSWARVQGKEANMRRFETSSFNCSNDEFLPVAFDPPRNGSDPNPPPPLIVGNLCPRIH